MANDGQGPVKAERAIERGRTVLHVTCLTHTGARGFTNLVMSKRNGETVMDPHATGQCVLTLDEDAATAARRAYGVARMTRSTEDYRHLPPPRVRALGPAHR